MEGLPFLEIEMSNFFDAHYVAEASTSSFPLNPNSELATQVKSVQDLIKAQISFVFTRTMTITQNT